MAGATSRRPRLRRLLAVVTLLGVLGLAAALILNLSLTSRLGRIDGAFEGLGERPPPAPGETILMVGTRPGGGEDVSWLPGDQSVEAVMLVEVRPDGRSARVESVPMPYDDRVGLGARPASAPVAAVESTVGRRVDHVMAIDWQTFATLAADNDVDAAYRYGSAPVRPAHYLRLVLEGTLHAGCASSPSPSTAPCAPRPRASRSTTPGPCWSSTSWCSTCATSARPTSASPPPGRAPQNGRKPPWAVRPSGRSPQDRSVTGVGPGA